MKITDITFTEENDQQIWEVLNDYRQFRLTASEGTHTMKQLIAKMIADSFTDTQIKESKPIMSKNDDIKSSVQSVIVNKFIWHFAGTPAANNGQWDKCEQEAVDSIAEIFESYGNKRELDGRSKFLTTAADAAFKQYEILAQEEQEIRSDQIRNNHINARNG